MSKYHITISNKAQLVIREQYNRKVFYTVGEYHFASGWYNFVGDDGYECSARSVQQLTEAAEAHYWRKQDRELMDDLEDYFNSDNQ